jgi:hypothetical protein
MNEGILAYNILEACRVSGISRTSLYEHFKAGTITPRKDGKRTLVLASDLKRFLESLPAAQSPTTSIPKHRQPKTEPVAA